MTTKEMVYNCDGRLKTITKSEDIFIPTTEWLQYLNEAQEMVFRDNLPFNQENFTQFDLSTTTRNNLAALIKDKQYIPADSRTTTTSKFSGVNYIFEYPIDLKYVDGGEVNMVKNGRTVYCRVKDIEPRYYHQNRKNPFKKPNAEIVWRMDYGSNGKRYNEIVIPEGFTLNNFTLRYIINLPCLDYESDSLLASSLHIDIVNKAVDICMKAHQNNLYLKQVAMQQNNERE